tara:strand:- start:217 stop:474 length:258 start_codon:yes stop_codon:yes gene_type:complete
MNKSHQIPSGWLISPKGDQMILFIKDPMSNKNLIKFYIDNWSALNGLRSKFKSRKIMLQDDAFRIWNNLIENGWNQINPLQKKAA